MFLNFGVCSKVLSRAALCIVCLIGFSCASETPSEVPVENTLSDVNSSPDSPSATIAIPQPEAASQPEATPQPEATTQRVQLEHVVNDGGYCQIVDVAQVKPTLDYPVDLVATADGSKIYILNKRCLQSVYPNVPYELGECDGNRTLYIGYSRNYIHELNTKTGKLSLLKFNGVPPLSCEIGEELEIDDQGRLYVNATRNHRLYRLDLQQQKIELIHDVRINQSKPNPFIYREPGSSFQVPFLKGPAHLYWQEDIYFSMSALQSNLEGVLYRITSENKNQRISYSQGIGRYMPAQVYQGQIYLGWSRFVQNPATGEFEAEPIDLEFDPEIMKLNTIRKRFDTKGTLFLTDENHYIYQQTFPEPNSSYMSIYAGTGEPGLKDGPAKEAQFNMPTGISFDQSNNMYVADMLNHAIRKITPDGTVSTLYQEPKS